MEEVCCPQPRPDHPLRTSEGSTCCKRVRDAPHRAPHLPPTAPFQGMISSARTLPGLGQPGAPPCSSTSDGPQAEAARRRVAALPFFVPHRRAVHAVSIRQSEHEQPDCVGERKGGMVPRGIEVALVSGLSGAGRSTAAKVLEDLGWFVVDNLPPELIATMVDLGARASGEITRIAVVMDVRSRAFTADLGAVIKDLDMRGYKPRLLFLRLATRCWCAG